MQYDDNITNCTEDDVTMVMTSSEYFFWVSYTVPKGTFVPHCAMVSPIDEGIHVVADRYMKWRTLLLAFKSRTQEAFTGPLSPLRVLQSANKQIKQTCCEETCCYGLFW